MKKFLSLALSLVMVLSLTTIGAGATEYKDFTDKDEIQYAEAVSVLNRLGIITGYSEGDFRPEGELTRGAAAKIIVSLLIGPNAAEALGNNSSPFPDVPAGNNFAGVIGYCKTAKIIGGYGDGTFRPQGTLTGYAFAKMLLGALGYKTEYEGFEGAGWNMNVARIGGEVGLFDRISFNGNETVTREQACQLALNTLKTTMVEYSGGMDISTSDGTSIVAKPERNYKLSANKEINKNIFAGQPMVGTGNEYYTLEFGEEHFVDLRLDGEATNRTDFDDFGRPSNVWSYKKVTIGTFPVDPDFLYTEQTQHSDATDAAKNRATGLSSYKVDDDTRLCVNGEWIDSGDIRTALDNEKVSAISDCTDNGTVVEVYVSDEEANYITDVVVIQTQLMEVRRVGSDYVSLQMYDNGASDDDDAAAPFSGFNNKAINKRVENVQAEDDMYGLLSGLKVGDIVAVIPYTNDDGATWEVGDAYVPETVSGAITGVVDYGKTNDTRHTVGVTVGGTAYDVALWNVDLHDITSDVIKATKKDVTLYLDRNGNAMLAKDVGATNDWMIVGAFRQALENGRIVHLVTGWDISGTALELNVGTIDYQTEGIMPGDLVKYRSTTSNVAEWRLDGTASGDVYDVFTGNDSGTNNPYEIKASNTRVNLVKGATTELVTYDKNVKFIYVNFDEEDAEVESIEVKTVRQNVTNDELSATYQNRGGVWNPAQACVKDNAVKAVVIKSESNEAIATNMLYVRDYYGSAAYDSTGKMVYGYRVAMNTASNFDDDMVIYSYDKLSRGDFASYSATENADHSEFYTLRRHNNFVNRTTATYAATFQEIVDENNGFVKIESGSYGWVNGSEIGSSKPTDAVSGNDANGDPYTPSNMPGLVQVSRGDLTVSSLGAGNQANIVDVKNANFLDLRSNSEKNATREISTYNDLKAVMMYNGVAMNKMDVVMIVNDNPSNDGFRTVSMVVINSSNSTGNTEAGVDAMNSLDSFGFKGVEWKITSTTIEQKRNDTGVAITLTGDEEGSKAVAGNLSVDYTGKSVKITINGSVVTPGTVTLRDGDEIKVTVTARNGNEKVYTCANVYVTEKARTPYVNTTALELDADGAVTGGTALVKDADGFVANNFQDTADNVLGVGGAAPTSTILKIDTGALTAPVVLTGDNAKTRAQLLEAIDYLGYKIVGADPTPAAGVWTLNICDKDTGANERQITFTEANNKAYTLFKLDNKDTLVAANTTEGDASLGLTVGRSSKDGTSMASVGGSAIVPMTEYVKEAFVELDMETTHNDHDVSSGFTMEYYVDGTKVDEGDWVPVNSDVEVRFIASSNISNGASVVTAAKIEIASGTGYTWSVSKNTVLGSGTGTTFTFSDTVNTKVIPQDEYVSVTVNVGTAAKYVLDKVTYTAVA